MNRTGRAIVLGALVTLVLGADWALEKAFMNYHLDAVGVSEPAPPPSDSVASPMACEPADMPAATDSGRLNGLFTQA